MNSRAVILAAVLPLAVGGAAVQALAKNPPYLSQFPPVERVRAEVRGADEMETAAKQAAVFWHLHELILYLAYADHRTDRQFTPDERSARAMYYKAFFSTIEPFGEISHRNPRWMETYNKYRNDRSIVEREVMQKHFTPRFRKQATAALYGETPAGANAGPTATPAGRPAAPAGGVWPFKGQTGGVTPLYVITWLLVYFSPTIVALLKKRRDPDPGHGARLLFCVALINTFFGWLCIGWCLAWALVLFKPFGDLFTKQRGGGGGRWPPPADPEPTPKEKPSPCPRCNGTGQQTCPSCLGNPYRSGVPCTYCIASGRVQCQSPSHR